MQLTKLRQVYRVFFPKIFTAGELFELKLQRNTLIAHFEKKESCYNVTLTNGLKIKIRDEAHSDYQVFEQIFNFKEYDFVLNLIVINNLCDSQNIIIDAGANVGYTTLFIHSLLTNSVIYAIEPSTENTLMFTENISCLKNNNNIKLYQNALSHKEGMFYAIDRDFRDGKDWSITTTADNNGSISGISIKEIIEQNNLKYITLLKIDIEGAERFIFNTTNDLSFLSITKVLAIEIHDEFNIRDVICDILRNNNFIIMNSGELTVAINKSFL